MTLEPAPEALFPEPELWPDDDLIGFSELVTADAVLSGYREGVFPMPSADGLAWFSPLQRGILPLDNLRVTRSLRKSARHYTVTVDTDFYAVLAGCANPARDHGWIDEYVAWAYGKLFTAGVVHTVEVRDGADELVGGLYGVQVGGLFAGESMFHDRQRGRDASKVALLHLVNILSADGIPRLLDVQWRTDHLATLGVVEIERDDYLQRLGSALTLPAAQWPTPGAVLSAEIAGAVRDSGPPTPG